VSSVPPSGPASGYQDSFGSDHRAFDHAVQFYLDESFLLRLLSRMIRSAAPVGGAAIVIATENRLEALARRLFHEDRASNLDSDQHPYVALDASELLAMCRSGGAVDLSRLKASIQNLLSQVAGPHGETQRRLFIYGELVALLCAEGRFDAALELERIWDEFGRTWMFSLLCGYPIRQFDKPGFEKFFIRICATHATVSPPESYPSVACERRIAYAIANSSWLLDQNRHFPPT